jgi:hypothetical protein
MTTVLLKVSRPTRDPYHIATLFIALPSYYEGGDTRLFHDDECKTVDFSALSNTEYQYLAWYSDVFHEDQQVTAGVKLVFEYGIFVTDHSALRIRYLDVGDSQLIRLRDTLVSWDKSSTGPTSPYLLMYKLEYHYKASTSVFSFLRGNDQVRTRVLERLCKQLGFKLFLASYPGYPSSSIEEPPESIEEFLDLWDLCSPDGSCLACAVRIPSCEILQRNPCMRDPAGLGINEIFGQELEAVEQRYFCCRPLT